MALSFDKTVLTTLVTPLLAQAKLSLYEINSVHEFENDIVQILVEPSEHQHTISFDALIQANELISAALDEHDLIGGSYILEVSSAGIERQIKTPTDLTHAVPSYVFVQYHDVDGVEHEFNGDLVEAKDDTYLFHYFLKGQPKKISLAWYNIVFIRYAVKF